MACLLLSLPANALFLAGQAEPGGAISVLCEGQSRVFLSLPSGGLQALPLDPDFQAEYAPVSSGPYTFQCGNETKTVLASLPRQAGAGAYPGGENLFLAAGMAAVFLAALLAAAKYFLRPTTVFSKSAGGGRAAIFLRAGEDLREITITDLQGGEGGRPLSLSIPHLSAGAEWNWEYECDPGGPLLAARLSAKCRKGGVSLVSCVEGGAMQKQAAGGAWKGWPAQKQEAGGTGMDGKRKLKRAA